MVLLRFIFGFLILVGSLMPRLGFAESKSENDLIIHNPKRAEFNWMMNCQGCHGVKGEGNPGGAPPMPGVVNRFLEVEGGREYLARVPGVATSPINDKELADLLNWMLLRFSCGSLPKDFVAYKGVEIGKFRDEILITNAHIVRETLLSKLINQPTPKTVCDALS